jgi:hypothetical protein
MAITFVLDNLLSSLRSRNTELEYYFKLESIQSEMKNWKERMENGKRQTVQV